MKKAMRDHLYAYGRIRGFLTTHARLSDGVKGPSVPQDLDRYCDFCCRFQTETSPCEHYQLACQCFSDKKRRVRSQVSIV